MAGPSLKITEIFHSIQGESSFAGLPCVFVRLTGCSLRCRWCDTTYGFSGGRDLSFDEILEECRQWPTKLIEITGGEPLDQPVVIAFMAQLQKLGYLVLIETSGAVSVKDVPEGVRIIMDLKAPGSRMADRNLLENLDHLDPDDEVKVVVADRADFDWLLEMNERHRLADRFKLLVSPAFGLVKFDELSEWLLTSGLKARLNLQQHKLIWSPRARGV